MKALRVEIKWALIFSAMSLLWMLLERLVGLHDRYLEYHPIYTNFVAIPAILIYVLALLEKCRRDHQGAMTYGQGLRSGLILTGFIALLAPLVQLITSKVITPHYFANVIALSVKKGLMSQAAAEAYFNLPNYLVQSVVGAAVMGSITTAVVAWFTRGKKEVAAD